MQKKGIAINTILLLVVGLIVVSILAYVVYRTFTGSGLSREDCRGRLVSWCTSCEFSGYSSNIKVGNSLANACGNIYTEIGTATDSCSGKKNFCAGFLPKATTST